MDSFNSGEVNEKNLEAGHNFFRKFIIEEQTHPGFSISSEQFIEEIEKIVGKRLKAEKKGRPRKQRK